MSETKTQRLMCDNPECPNFGYNLLWTDPNEWGPCCEAQVKRHDEAISKLGYDTELDLDELYQDDDPPTVQLIASGYEWLCPHCDELNKQIEITYSAECNGCNRKYTTGDIHHAHG